MSKKNRTIAVFIVALLLIISTTACKPKTSTSSSVSSSGTTSGSDIISNEDSSSSDVSSEITGSTADSSQDISGSSITSETGSTGTSSTGTTSKTSTTSKAGTTPTSSVIKYDTTGIIKDLQGRKVVLHTFESLSVTGPNDKHLERLYANVAKIEKQYNCDIVLDHNINWGTIAATVMAGQPEVDIWLLQGNVQLAESWLPAYVAGLLQPLEPLKCFNFNEVIYQNPLQDMLTVNGVHYGVVAGEEINGKSSITGWFNNQVAFYRYDVLQASGVTNDMMPDNLAKAGKWTWDNFAKVCEKVRAAGKIPVNDYAGNGEINQTSMYLIMCYTYGTDIVVQDPKTKKVTFNGGSAKALQVLDHYVSFVANNLINAPDCTDSFPMQMNGSDDIAFQFYDLSLAKFGFPSWGTELSKANWGMTHIPKVKESDPYTIIATQNSGGYTIPFGVKRPRDAATILQAWNHLTRTTAERTAWKNEFLADYALYLPSNEVMAESIARVEKEQMDLSFTPAQKFYLDDIANGCGVSKDWLTHVQKIATGQENAATVIKSVTANYNNLLKDLYVIR